ncbi:6-bladed beta-propeller [Sphingobacterium griseoflavum]|uniref:6-bladed beta-propeller n=1 Tax=Sphingobacterium griseoflavum TaxID=1474952 RepID=A0ABQ3HSA5_9SPHI|nr:6-bladed beta-propeller [Sphingobacterium griseoflavum]GHE23719.1 hypothetical protein GCM10017764_06870 [Sphingobacterium griseoflavum]
MAQNKENNHTDSVLTWEFRISPAHAQHKTMQEVMEEIEYIPLASSKNSEFAFGSNIVVDRDRIIVYHFFDYKNYLLIFDTKGKLIKRIDIPKDRLNGKQLFLDRDKQEIYISDAHNTSKALVYNYDGTLLRDAQTLPYGIYGKIGDSYISYRMHRYRIDKDNPYDLLYYKGMEVANKWMYYKRDTSEQLSGQSDMQLRFSGKLPILSTIYDYKLHFLSEAGIDSVYRFVLPQNLSVPADFLENEVFWGKKSEFFKNDPAKIVSFQNHYHTPNNLAFKLDHLDFYGHRVTDVIYNTVSGTLVNLEFLQPDQTNDFLPFFEKDYFFHNINIVASDGTNIYTLVAPATLIEAYRNNKANNITDKFPASLEKILKNERYTDNYVLVRIKLKPKF